MIPSFANCRYLPILSLRPAEMTALGNLPAKDKKQILPAIQIRPWLGANYLKSSIDKIKEVMEGNPWIGSLDKGYDLEDHPPHPGRRVAINEFENLTNSDNGHEKWCDFVANTEDMIPTLQLNAVRASDPSELQISTQQIERFAKLQRGIVLHYLPSTNIPAFSEKQVRILNQIQESLLIIIDFENITKNESLSLKLTDKINEIRIIFGSFPNARIAVSSTSFPAGFSNLKETSIREREMFNLVKTEFQSKELEYPLLYSDRASVRIPTIKTGGGILYPRIDLPTKKNHYFFRNENSLQRNGMENIEDFRQRRRLAYRNVAKNVMEHPQWKKKIITCWGIEKIKSTAAGDEVHAIQYPGANVAARVNMHLMRQLHEELAESGIRRTSTGSGDEEPWKE